MPPWVLGTGGGTYDGVYVAKYVVHVATSGPTVYHTPPVVPDIELDMFAVDPGDPATTHATATLPASYTDGTGAPGANPHFMTFPNAAGTYWVVAVAYDYPTAWDPAVDWGTFNLSSDDSSVASPWPSMDIPPSPLATETEIDVPLEWSFDVTGAVGTSTWTGDDDDRWQFPLEWSFLIDLDPVDDVEDPA